MLTTIIYILTLAIIYTLRHDSSSLCYKKYISAEKRGAVKKKYCIQQKSLANKILHDKSNNGFMITKKQTIGEI